MAVGKGADLNMDRLSKLLNMAPTMGFKNLHRGQMSDATETTPVYVVYDQNSVKARAVTNDYFHY